MPKMSSGTQRIDDLFMAMGQSLKQVYRKALTPHSDIESAARLLSGLHVRVYEGAGHCWQC